MEGNHPGLPFIGPPRSYRTAQFPKRYILIHNTANDATAAGEAAYAKRRTDGVSSHYYADADQVIQSLNTKYGANHVASYTGNNYAISYELTGTNAKSRQWWIENLVWGELSSIMALDCKEYGIPARLLTIEQMQDGRSKGFCTHDMARQAWGGTTHTDPGKNFPLDLLIDLVDASLGGNMTTASEVNNLYVAEFKGGPSCGEPVDDEYRTRLPDGTFANPYGNSNVENRRQIKGDLKKVLKALNELPAGPAGPAGPQGEPGVSATWPANIIITGVAEVNDVS